MPPRSLARLLVAAACLVHSRSAIAQTDPGVELVLPTGRPLRVTLTDNTTVHKVGQTVTARVTEAVYSYDRIVLPVGSLVEGRITKLEAPSKLERLRSMTAGDFSPHRTVELRFESVIRDGERTPINTIAKNEAPRVLRATTHTAEPDAAGGSVARAKAEVKSRAAEAVAGAKQKVVDAIASAKDPDRMERLKQWAIDRLPYHRQVLRKGTVYDAELESSVSFGTAPTHALAPEGTVPKPDSILTARLLTTLDSRATPRGFPLEAVVSEPVFAEDGRLIFPEGTKLTGEVTFAQPARRFHRNGQLRFLFERVEAPDHESTPLLASLHAVDVSADTPVALDDEGGAAVQNSKTRFVEPALALLALRASADQGEGRGFERSPTAARPTSVSAGGGNPLGRGLGGLIGFGVIGLVVGQVSHPLGIAFSAVGAARSVYTNILGRGQEVRFPADTPIQVQLAPNSASQTP